jgi:flagellar hook-associated protein 2
MTEDEIEKWEEKAKSGTLHGDAYISSLLTTLRSAFYTTVEGTGMKMSDIGLTTGTYSDGAKITVNKDKLLAALKEDPEAVKSMFVQTSDANDFDQQGLVVRISSSLLNYTQKTTDIALDSLEERITMSEEKQEALETRMEEKEKALWKKFSEMEAALAQLNSLSGWLSTLFVS